MQTTKDMSASSNVSNEIERRVRNEPVNANIRTLLLAAAGVSIACSLAMQLMSRKHEALFIGQWAPTLVSAALWYQIVKMQQGRQSWSTD